MLTVSHFTNVNVLFLGFHYLIRYMEIWEKHNRESLRNRGGKSSEYFICEFLTQEAFTVSYEKVQNKKLRIANLEIGLKH